MGSTVAVGFKPYALLDKNSFLRFTAMEKSHSIFAAEKVTRVQEIISGLGNGEPSCLLYKVILSNEIM
jgi:hypothetical protein